MFEYQYLLYMFMYYMFMLFYVVGFEKPAMIIRFIQCNLRLKIKNITQVKVVEISKCEHWGV